jgi:hypothetical protein
MKLSALGDLIVCKLAGIKLASLPSGRLNVDFFPSHVFTGDANLSSNW